MTTAAVLITMTATMMTGLLTTRAEMHMFRQNHPAEMEQEAVQIQVQAAVPRIRAAERTPALAVALIRALAVALIRALAAVRIPAAAAVLIRVREAVRTPVQGQRPADSNHWTFLRGACMIVGSGQTGGSRAVRIKYYS